jgi:phosphonate transport system ATP-binding protein
MSEAAFVASGVSKRYRAVEALGTLSLTIEPGEAVALVGPSGSGKTTLLHVLGGIVRPDTGTVSLHGRDLERLRPGRELARLVGVMHQQYDLVPHLAVVHNVLAGRLGEWGTLRALVSLVSPRDVPRAEAALTRVGLAHRMYERTSRLSGGEQQRVALARLLVQDPRAILADEPVSALDPARAEDLLELLVSIAREGERTLVASLHAIPLVLKYFSRVIALRDGGLLFDRATSEVRPSDLEELYALDDRAAALGAPARGA